MAYSTITKKKCKGECGNYPAFGLSGWCWNCVPESIKEKVGNRKKLAQKNKNSRLSQTIKLRQVQNDVEGSDSWKSKLWFSARHYEMTGKCFLCNGKTEKGTAIFKNSIAHLFQKAYFKSIKWHELNWMELCYYGHSHHTNFDNAMLSFEIIKEEYPLAWVDIVKKFKILYPLMTNSEQGRVPQILIETLNN